MLIIHIAAKDVCYHRRGTRKLALNDYSCRSKQSQPQLGNFKQGNNLQKWAVLLIGTRELNDQVSLKKTHPQITPATLFPRQINGENKFNHNNLVQTTEHSKIQKEDMSRCKGALSLEIIQTR